jgi:hypothetical protein
MRRAFKAADVVYAVDESGLALFYGRREADRMTATGEHPGIVLTIPMDLSNPDNTSMLMWACVHWKGSCCAGPEIINPLAN